MDEKIIKILEKDKNIKALLCEFKDDFNRVCCELSEENKFKILNLRDAIFRVWLNSPLVDETYITPNLIINNIAQSKIKGNYSVIPHIKTKVDNKGDLTFETRWLYYGIDKIPVMEDIELLINHSMPSLTVRSENAFVVDNGEDIIDELNFRSGYYIMYLIELATKIGALKKMKSIGCEVYQVTNKYNEYMKLDNEEKVNLILKHSIDISNKNLSEAPHIKELLKKNRNDNVALKLLNNNIGEVEYCENIGELARQINSMLGNIENYSNDINEINEIKNMEAAFQGNMAEMLLLQEIGIYIDMNFLSIFGYYLGIIRPAYVDFYIMDVVVDLLLKADEAVEALVCIFKLDGIHDLTELGEVLIKDYNKKVKEKGCSNFDIKIMDTVMECHHSEKEQYGEEFKYMNLDNDYVDDFDFYADDSNELSKAILTHLQEFYIYLRDVRGLKDSTCEKSAGNMELFIAHCLRFTKRKELDNIVKEDVHYYLSHWFIHKVASSRNSVKGQISSLGQYIKFMEEKGFMDKDTGAEIKVMIKDKDKYINMFDNYLNDLF